MATGSIHASHCATQPIYATVTDNYAQNSMPTITLKKIPRVNLKFPGVFQVFQSCKHPVLAYCGPMPVRQPTYFRPVGGCYKWTKAQYTPPTPTRRNCRVSSRRRCVHEFATSSRRLPTDSAMRTHNAAVSHDPVYNTAANGTEVRYDVTYDAACF